MHMVINAISLLQNLYHRYHLSNVSSFKGGYTQAWLRGDENTDADGGAMPHEGLRLKDGSGWVAIGETNILTVGDKTTRVTQCI